jgi:hypothetical protein
LFQRLKFAAVAHVVAEQFLHTRDNWIDKLLNTEDPTELIKTGNKEASEVEVEEITIEDLEKAIRNNKAAGTDDIHPELIKYGGNKLLSKMYDLVRQVWEEERIPE